MAARPQRSLLQRIMILGAVLAAIQVVIIVLLPKSSGDLSPKESINKALDTVSNVTPERKEMMKIQLALADFMAKNGGKPPANLAVLMPTYFDQIPQNPTTGKPFPYRVEGIRYYLGDASSKPSPGGTATGQKDTSSGKESQAGSVEKVTEEQKADLLSALAPEATAIPAYDAKGKRDPFRPFDLSPDSSVTRARSALEAYPVDKLTYTAFVQGAEPRAIVESLDGKGFTVKKGDKIGTRNGEITEIRSDKIVIVETETDFTGDKRTKTVELNIGVKAIDSSSLFGGRK